jgi:hypothetical protein
MQIREGAYYRTRGGDVVGPIRNDETTSIYPLTTIGQRWTISGRFSANSDGPLDLIGEVYVSDTPPAKVSSPFIHPASDSATSVRKFMAPEAKTLRDEFAMEAMKLLFPKHGADWVKVMLAIDAYKQADAMMEAREK